MVKAEVPRSRAASGVIVCAVLSLALACSSGDDEDDDAPPATASGGSTATASGGTATTSGGAATTSGGAATASGGTATASGGTATTSGGTSAAAGDFDSGLPEDAPLESLDPSQLTEFCETGQEHLQETGLIAELAEALCAYYGVIGVAFLAPETDAEARALCQQTYDACVAEPMEPSDCSEPTGSMCPVTVGEMEACMAAYPEYVRSLRAAAPPCSELTLPEVDETANEEVPTPAACERPWRECGLSAEP